MDGPLFDFQVNGFGGVDFQADGISRKEWEIALGAMRRAGLGGVFVTLISDDTDRLCRKLEAFERARRADAEFDWMVPGYHLEGPWLSPEPGYCGAHPAASMHAPSVGEFDRLQAAASGRLRLITLAPEWPGSDEVIAHAVQQGAHVSLGHTQASEAQIDGAIAAGARFATHVGNGTPGIMPRHDNVVQRLLARDELIACLIPDGVHLPPNVLKNFYRAKPEGKVLFTTDAMAGAGMGSGSYRLGRLEIEIGADGVARQPGATNLAGSTLTPDQGVKNIQRWLGLSADEATRMWSQAPIEAFGLM